MRKRQRKKVAKQAARDGAVAPFVVLPIHGAMYAALKALPGWKSARRRDARWFKVSTYSRTERRELARQFASEGCGRIEKFSSLNGHRPHQ